MSVWETFCDDSYYHLWRVRRRNEQGFNNGFHVQNAKEAAAVVEFLTRLELDLCEAKATIEDAKRALGANEHEGLLLAAQRVKEQHDKVQESAVFFNEKAETMRLERDEAREEWGKASMDAAQLLSEKTHVIAERDEAQEMQSKALRERESTEREVEAMLERAIKAERERDEARNLLGLKKEPKWYNGREIPIAVEEAAK